MWKLSIEDDQGNKTVVKLVRDEYTVGRAEDNAIRLTERNISRQHARVLKSGPGWMLGDCRSYNGCFVNGGRVNDTVRLEHGDLVQLGDYRLTLLDERLQPVAIDSSAPTRGDALIGQPDRLVMLVGPTPGAEFAMNTDRLIVGRGEECDVAINHSSVSRVHAEVQSLGQARYEIIDLGSSNGVRINGIELQRSLLHPRDVIELGDVILKFIPAGEIYKPTLEESQQIGALSAAFAHQAVAPARGVPTSAKIIAGVVGLGLLMVLGVIIFGRQPAPEATPAAPSAQPMDRTMRAIAEARALLDSGDVEGAHARVLAAVPEGSNARESREFREIEARWADTLFQRARAEDDPAKKKELYGAIARATTVDLARRKRANNELERLSTAESAELDITQLPSSAPAPVPPPAAMAVHRPAHTASRAPAAAAEAKTSRTPAPAASVADGIVRENPFEQGGGQQATTSEERSAADASGEERRQAIATKNALKTKAAGGTASEHELHKLRTLCQKLGDTSCTD